jgi:hypothetical protein
MSLHTKEVDYQRVESRAVPATPRGNGVNEVEAVSDAGGRDGKVHRPRRSETTTFCVMMRRGGAEGGVRGFGSAGHSVPALPP